RVPAILHLHGADFDSWYLHSSRWKQRIVRAIFDRAAAIIVLSQRWRKWAMSVSRNPFIVAIYNPVRIPDASAFGARDAASVLFLGQLGSRKGTYDLLQAVARLATRHPTLKLVLAGDGDIERVRTE